MPRYNAAGQLSGQMRDWFDGSRTVYQDCSPGYCRVILSDGTVVDPRANAGVVAGGGGRAAWWDELVPEVRDTAGRHWPGAGLAQGCSLDGAYALKLLRDSYGPWNVIEADGSWWRMSDGDAHDIQLLGGRRAIWMVGNDHFCTSMLPIALPTELTWGRRAAWVPDRSRFLTLYQRQSDGALVCDGRIVAPPSASYFYPDVAYINGAVRIAWAPTQADLDPQEIVLTLAQLAALPRSSDVPARPALARFSHPVTVAVFKDPDRLSGCPSIETDFRTYLERVTLVDHTTPGRIVFGLDTATDPVLPAGLRPYDCVLLECYRLTSETLDQTVARWLRQMRQLLALWPGDVGVIAQCYTQAAPDSSQLWPVSAVLDGLVHVPDVVNLDPRIKLLACFAYERADEGITAHVELHDRLTAFVAASPGSATLTPVPSPAPTPKPIPKPAPAPAPTTPFPAARPLKGSTMRVYLKVGPYYTGVNPTPKAGTVGDAAFPVYWNRPNEPNQGGDWERVELEQQADGRFRATYIESQRVLSIQPDGTLQTRVAGTYGGYEQLDGTTQPAPDAINLLYRVDGGVMVGTPLTIEEAQ